MAGVHRHLFAERLNQILSDAEFPALPAERATDFAKIFDLDAITAERLISGLTAPSEKLIIQIAEEFEVDPLWLSGQA